MFRIVVFQLGYETNTFVPGPGELSHMGAWVNADQVVDMFTGKRAGLSGILAALTEEGAAAIPVDLVTRDTSFNAGPTLSAACIESVVDRLCASIEALHGEYDGVCADMHGAGCAYGYDDVDTYILRRVREVVGDKPVMAALDLHGNMTQDMLDLSDGLFGIKTNPHVDNFEAGYTAAKTLIARLSGQKMPKMVLRRIPLLFPVAIGSTLDGPCRTIKDHFESYVHNHNLIDATFFHGFFAADTPCTCASVLVVADGYEPKREADELARYVWDMREALAAPSYTAAEAIDVALSLVKDGYVVVNEGSDNPGSGCPGDGTHLLREMLERNLPRCIMGPMYDAAAASLCHTHQVGETFPLTVGGHTAPIYGEPLCLDEVELLALSDGDFICVSPAHKGSLMHYGLSARVRHGNVEFIVVSNRFQVYDDQPYRMTGADLRNYDIVGLKSSNHFRAFFQEHADAIVGADTPSAFPGDVRRLDFKRVCRPIYPLDENVEFCSTWPAP